MPEDKRPSLTGSRGDKPATIQELRRAAEQANAVSRDILNDLTDLVEAGMVTREEASTIWCRFRNEEAPRTSEINYARSFRMVVGSVMLSKATRILTGKEPRPESAGADPDSEHDPFLADITESQRTMEV